MKIFVFAERQAPIVELCGGARRFADEVDLIATPDSDIPDNVANKIFLLQVPEGRMFEDAAPALAKLILEEKPDAVFLDSSRRIQLIMGRVAARLQTSIVSNVMKVECLDEVTKMYYGGLADRTLKAKDSLALYYIRAATFGQDVENEGDNTVIEVPFVEPEYQITLEEVAPRVKGSVDLTSAKRIVGIGRGVKKESDLEMIREFCDLIGAEMSCSRSIYETEGWLPKEALVGISGTTVTPNLYLMLGISGQAQHMVACSGSTTIMCVNNDPYAMIFEQADYGSKADLYEVVPALIEYFKANPLK